MITEAMMEGARKRLEIQRRRFNEAVEDLDRVAMKTTPLTKAARLAAVRTEIDAISGELMSADARLTKTEAVRKALNTNRALYERYRTA